MCHLNVFKNQFTDFDRVICFFVNLSFNVQKCVARVTLRKTSGQLFGKKAYLNKYVFNFIF